MNFIRTSLKKYYKFIIFLGVIFVIGVISGFVYFSLVKDNIVIDLQNELVNLRFSFDNFIYHLIILSLICFMVFLIFGVIFGLFIYFYEAMSIGFILSAFFYFFGFSGLLYGILFVIIYKSLYLLFISFLLVKVINFSKNIIGFFLLKKDAGIKDNAIKNFLKIIKCCIFILINDFFLLFIGDKLISIFAFLIDK